ncbi:MAG: hypothetical protein M3Y23_04680 [Actinomycetota bacterium]|nr:hypothetical protein [Actinomycetota bacterium]
MNFSLFWKSILVQLLAVAVLFFVLAVLLPKSFFEDWGWLSGPVAWMLCALVTATVLRLPKVPVLVGAALAGLPAIVFVVLGLHAVASPVAAVFFGLWCGYRIPSGPSAH